jgi:hypothetical protein
MSPVRNRVAVDRFTTSRSDTTMSMRGVDRAVSPVGDGFADYLRDALQREIRRANLLDEEVPTRLSGNIVENHFRTWKGQTVVSVEFVVRRDDSERYRRTIRWDLPWNSAFSGVVAQTSALQCIPPRSASCWVSSIAIPLSWKRSELRKRSDNLGLRANLFRVDQFLQRVLGQILVGRIRGLFQGVVHAGYEPDSHLRGDRPLARLAGPMGRPFSVTRAGQLGRRRRSYRTTGARPGPYCLDRRDRSCSARRRRLDR